MSSAPAPPRHLLSTLPAPSSARARLGRLAALGVATAGPIAAGIALRLVDLSTPKALWVPVGLLVLSALLAHHGRAGSQILARSVWWANLLLGTLLAVLGGDSERAVGLVMVVGTGAPLLAMGRLGLGEDEESAFRPVAFRSTLGLAMVMAVADAQALVFWGLLKLERDTLYEVGLAEEVHGAILLGAAAVIVVAIVGLYRLRVWGLILGALSAAGLVALAVSNVCGLKGPVPQVFVATSLVQLALPVPVLAAVVRGRAPQPPARLARMARLVPAVVVGVMVAMSAWGVLFVQGPLFR